jgi:hypothetical protein
MKHHLAMLLTAAALALGVPAVSAAAEDCGAYRRAIERYQDEQKAIRHVSGMMREYFSQAISQMDNAETRQEGQRRAEELLRSIERQESEAKRLDGIIAQERQKLIDCETRAARSTPSTSPTTASTSPPSPTTTSPLHFDGTRMPSAPPQTPSTTSTPTTTPSAVRSNAPPATGELTYDGTATTINRNRTSVAPAYVTPQPSTQDLPPSPTTTQQYDHVLRQQYGVANTPPPTYVPPGVTPYPAATPTTRSNLQRPTVQRPPVQRQVQRPTVQRQQVQRPPSPPNRHETRVSAAMRMTVPPPR